MIQVVIAVVVVTVFQIVCGAPRFYFFRRYFVGTARSDSSAPKT